MIKVSDELYSQLRLSTKNCWVNKDNNDTVLSFESQGIIHSHELKLNVNSLNKHEVIAITKIIDSAARLLAFPIRGAIPKIDFLSLHTSTEESILYMRSVLQVQDWTDSHKLGLLVSGALVIDQLGIERTWQLATMKTDAGVDWNIEALDPDFRIGLLKYYLVPGVTSIDNAYNISGVSSFEDINALYSPKTIAVANFLSLNSPNRTLHKQYYCDVLPVLEAHEQLPSFEELEEAMKILEHDEKDSILNLTSSQLRLLMHITYEEKISESLLETLVDFVSTVDYGIEFSAAKQIVMGGIKNSGTTDFLKFVNPSKKAEFDQLTLDDLHKKCGKSLSQSGYSIPAMVVIAHIFSKKGPEKVLEVLKSIKSITSAKEFWMLTVTEANEVGVLLASLAAESLKSENSDLPFDWVESMSEYPQKINNLIDFHLSNK